MNSFTDAAAEAVARAIAGVQREALRERELREAQFAAKMADLDARLHAISDVEKKLADRLESLKDGEPGKSVTVDDVAPLIEAEVAKRVAEIPAPQKGEPGKDADPELIEQMVAEKVAATVAAIPPAENGKDADEEAIFERLAARLAEGLAEVRESVPELPDIPAIVAEAVSAIPAPKDGKDADPDLIREMVQEAISHIPAPKDGKDADPEEVARLVSEMVREAVEALPLPEKGDPGPMGALPTVKAWEDRVYYEGEVVSFDGGVYQASRDTGKSPSHEDWTCIVRRGADGEDGRSFTILGTYDPEVTYSALDVVALNGASFAAKMNDPGPCPGDGWQLIASRGKPGKPGDKGPAGMGIRGLPGDPVTRMEIDEQGMLTLINGDGSEVTCDLYPVLSKLGG